LIRADLIGVDIRDLFVGRDVGCLAERHKIK
jgi:hypothetical protein